MYSMKRKTTEEEKEGEKTVVVSQDVLNYYILPIISLKRKALFMIKASKGYTSIWRKEKDSLLHII